MTLVILICAGCGERFSICENCFRGQSYCGVQCRTAARQESLRRAGEKYQRSREGRRGHADRQKRHRAQSIPRREKVTHHTSTPPARPITLLGADLSRSAVLRGSRFCWELIIDASSTVDFNSSETRASATAAHRPGARHGAEGPPASTEIATYNATAIGDAFKLVLPSVSRCARCGRRGVF